jgi:hypothetical protein
MSPSKIITALASVIFVFLMAPATAGVDTGDGQMTVNDTLDRVVVDAKIPVIVSLILGVVGSAVVVDLKKHYEFEYSENIPVVHSDLEVFTPIQSFPVTMSFPITKRSSATQKTVAVSERHAPSM